jgi:hypothetical protein
MSSISLSLLNLSTAGLYAILAALCVLLVALVWCLRCILRKKSPDIRGTTSIRKFLLEASGLGQELRRKGLQQQRRSQQQHQSQQLRRQDVLELSSFSKAESLRVHRKSDAALVLAAEDHRTGVV